MLMRIKRGAFEAQIEALGTAGSSFRFLLQAMNPGEPSVGIIISIDEFYAVLFRETAILIFAQTIFPLGMDIGIDLPRANSSSLK
jgi:hypothetical protein